MLGFGFKLLFRALLSNHHAKDMFFIRFIALHRALKSSAEPIRRRATTAAQDALAAD
jgi:hypothetical protein